MVANVKTIFIAYSFWAGKDLHPVTAVVTGSIQFGFLQSQLKDRSMVYWLYVLLFCICIMCIHSPSVSLNNENNIIVISHNLNYFNLCTQILKYIHVLCFHADFEWTATYQVQFNGAKLKMRTVQGIKKDFWFYHLASWKLHQIHFNIVNIYIHNYRAPKVQLTDSAWFCT